MELALLAAHMIGDYWAQTSKMSANKFTSWQWRTLHVICYTLCFVPFLLVWGIAWKSAALFLAALFVAHWITDCRRWASGVDWAPKPIMVDQALHLTQIAIFYKIFLAG